MPAAIVATTAPKDLTGISDPSDLVAIYFQIVSIAMVASRVFFLVESMAAGCHWKTSVKSGALVTLVPAVQCFYMREFWVQIGTSPIVYRYIDWSITVPLQMVEFYLTCLASSMPISWGYVTHHCRRLLVAILVHYISVLHGCAI